MQPRIESLLSARLHLCPQVFGEKIFFISNLAGKLNLYSMYYGGSVPQPLLPGHIALQNPELIEGISFKVFPLLDKILVIIDQDGDENYQPMLIPIEGGFPQEAFDGYFKENYRVHLTHCDTELNVVYFCAERKDKEITEAYRGNLRTNKVEKSNRGPRQVDHRGGIHCRRWSSFSA
jgi:hypothetical protein